MIDLHLHTTASDGRSSPESLVREALEAGISTLAVTDHDTTAALDSTAAAAEAAGLAFVRGIEITAVHQGRDVHILGYFLDAADAALEGFLTRQREDRRRRVREMGTRLARLGAPIDIDGLLARATSAPERAIGRPMVASALVDAGHAGDIAEAFDRFLAEGRPAFVERAGATPADVIGLVARAGGVASLAHPAKLGLDALIGPLASAGLPAIEIFHPDHDDADRARYSEIARRHDLVVTGGSDYHGPGSGRTSGLGRVSLPAHEFERLVERARRPDRSHA